MTITFENKNYTTEAFIGLRDEELPHWAQSAKAFLQAWEGESGTFPQQTSGSTGEPKVILLTKEQMVISAENTMAALHIPQKAKALHCINSDYIGGKMMWVRALLGKWHVHLIEPKGHFHTEEFGSNYDIAAMVPLQITNLFNDQRSGLLNRFSHVIIGGAAVSESLIVQLQDIQARCYSTFGMTETVSHIALRTLNGEQKSNAYFLVGDNQIATDERGCLQVKGSVTRGEWICTNDVVEIIDNGFQWLGRFDMIVNSAGIKIQMEKAEAALNEQLGSLDQHCFYWKEADELLGEKLIGLSDSVAFIEYLKANAQVLKEKLPKYHFPKKWYLCHQIVFTGSNKVDRSATAASSIKEFNF